MKYVIKAYRSGRWSTGAVRGYTRVRGGHFETVSPYTRTYPIPDPVQKLIEMEKEYQFILWDKALEKTGKFRYYVKSKGKDLGYLEFHGSTGRPVGATVEDPKILKAYQDACLLFKETASFDYNDIFGNIGIMVTRSGDSFSLQGKTFGFKDAIKKVGGRWDSYTNSWTLNENALKDLAVQITGWTKEEIADGKRKEITGGPPIGRPADPVTRKPDVPKAMPTIIDEPGIEGSGEGRKEPDTEEAKAKRSRELMWDSKETLEEFMKDKTIRDLVEIVQIMGVKPPDTEVSLQDDIKTALTLYDHQIVGAETILSAYKRESGFLLGDDTGTGKTFTGAAVIAQMKPKRCLILVPSDGIRNQWIDALGRCGIKGNSAEGTTTDFTGADGVLIATYTTFAANATLRGVSDLVVFDESQSLKNLVETPSNRALAAYDLVRKQMRADKKILYLSATPYEKPWQAKIYESLGLWEGDFDDWVRTQGVKIETMRIKTKYGEKDIKQYKLIGNGMQAVKSVLKQHLKSLCKGVFLQREVMPSGVTLTNEFKISKMSDEDIKNYNFIRSFFDKAADFTSNPLHRARLVGQKMFWSRRFLESAKLPLAIVQAENELKAGRKVAMMVGYRNISDVSDQVAKLEGLLGDYPTPEYERFKETLYSMGARMESSINIIKSKFPDAVEYHGGLTQKQKETAKKEYNEGKARLIIATQASAGIGLSLHDTKGDSPRSQINVTLPWTGMDMKQLAGRSHRLGTKSDTNQFWLFSQVDDEVKRAKIVAKKMTILGAAAKGIDVEDTDSIYEALAKFELDILDETDLSKSIKYVISLEKAMGGLVAKKVPVKSERGEYQAIRWTKPGEEPPKEGKEKPEAEAQPKIKVGDKSTIRGKEVTVTAVGKDGFTARDADGKKHLVLHSHHEKDDPKREEFKELEQKEAEGKPSEGIDPSVLRRQYMSTKGIKFSEEAPEQFKDYTEFIKGQDTGNWGIGKPEIMQYKDKVGIDVPLVTKDGKRFGHFEAQFSNDGKTVHIYSLFLAKDWQGKGVGTDIIRRGIEYAKQKGFQKATMMANGSSGVYAWGIQGFDWKKKAEIKELKDGFVKWVQRKYGEEVKPSKIKHAWDLASYKIGDEKVGKKYLLGPGHSLWFQSELNLADDSSMSWKIYNKYQELRERKKGEVK